MNGEEIRKLLENVSTPICQIELELGMPKTTLQKSIKGMRTLPKKWSIALRNKYPAESKLLPTTPAELLPVEFDFTGEKFLKIEKYTKFKEADRPKGGFERTSWDKAKTYSDAEIILAWGKRNK
jgi:hypothetical protein